MTRSALPLLLVSLVVLGSCGGSDSTDAETADGAGGFAQPQYLAVGFVFSPEGQLGYGAILNSLDADVEVELETAGVFPGLGSLAVSPDRDGRFWEGHPRARFVQRPARRDLVPSGAGKPLLDQADGEPDAEREDAVHVVVEDELTA